jgi:hypothetical protein
MVNELSDIYSNNTELTNSISLENNIINNKSINSDMQSKEIINKTEILHTRERMLEIVKEKNEYKMKIIYILLSLIILIIIGGLCFLTTKK